MRVLKWPVPVDDRPHAIGTGKVLLVACQGGPDVVQVWTEEHGDDPNIPGRAVQVFGTGQPVDPDRIVGHIGSTIAPHGLVWHVYEVTR